MTLRRSDLQSDSDLDSIRNSCVVLIIMFLGPRGPHGIPLLVSPFVRKKNLDHLYKGIYAF